ncbi:hypothetical protein SLS62_000987 [Diatrype stigma]|uniref:Fork-head domain-containing protein n=1 Tax=Diatrype stigma TaxID=117547 RepID=A0AAN9UZX9_9PEZI
MTAASPYAGAVYTGTNSESTDTMMQQSAPSLVPDLSEAHPKEEVDESTGLSESKPAASDGEGSAKYSNPYAKLLYKCLMEREEKMRNLQDIYQWFRDFTNKPQLSPGIGWQNSIRHNLSMNAAFTKRPDRLQEPASKRGTKEGKKETNWYLTEWAIRDGIQSTTRYRKENSNRRGGSRQPKCEGGKPSARARSGRKGGITASKTKAASRKASARRGAQNTAAAYCFNGNSEQNSMQDGLYNRPFEYQYSPSVRGAPVTPPDFHAGDMLIPDPTHAASNQGYMYQGTLPHSQNHHHGYLQNQQQHTQQQHPYHPSDSPFTLADVSGVYHGPPAPLPGRGQGVSTAMPTEYPLFANADEINMQWPGTGAGGEFQP